MGISGVWQPTRAWACGQLLCAAVLLGAVPLVDALGWLVLLPLGVLALAFGLRDLLLTPALAADGTGLRYVSGWRRLHVPWDEVERLREVRDRRTPLLEIDLGDHLVVLGERRLGAPVEEVLAELERVRQAS